MQNELIDAVAAANPNTIVVLQTGGPIEMPWLDKVSAVFQSWYPGQEAGNAIADVLFGDAEPGGRLPQTFPVRWSDNPAQSQDPEVYPGLNGKVRYEEGLFIGHKHYDKMGIAPLFPFGFGLSYTQFEWTNFRITPQGDDFIAEIDVTNTGSRAGSDVVQIYVEDKTPILPRPLRELKGFAKLHLGAGETGTARAVLSPRSFATFDVMQQRLDCPVWHIYRHCLTQRRRHCCQIAISRASRVARESPDPIEKRRGNSRRCVHFFFGNIGTEARGLRPAGSTGSGTFGSGFLGGCLCCHLCRRHFAPLGLGFRLFFRLSL